jgi:hypothetical protein
MSTPFFQDVNPATAPDPVTPHAAPSDPAGYDRVTPPGTGAAPAPYDISAPQDIAGITATDLAAVALAGAGVNEAPSIGPRQAAARDFLDSPQGIGAVSITQGFPDYENTDVNPGANMENPIQGQGGGYPGTTQGGVPQFGGNEGGPLPGAPPGGSMAGSPGGNYPGTTQEGLTKYGTS